MELSPNSCCYKKSFIYSGILVCVLIIIYGLGMPNALVLAADGPPENIAAKDEKIHIAADRLIASIEAKYAEFIGNVKVVQGTTEIGIGRIL